MHRLTLACKATRRTAADSGSRRTPAAAPVPFATWMTKQRRHCDYFLLQVFAGEAPSRASLRTKRWSRYLQPVELRLSPYDAAAHRYALQLLYFVCWGMGNHMPSSLAAVVERVGGGVAVVHESREPVLEAVVDGRGVPLVGWFPTVDGEDDRAVSCRSLARQALCRSFATPNRVAQTLFNRRQFLNHVHLRFHGADASLRSDTLLAVNGWPVVGGDARRRAQVILDELRATCVARRWDELGSRHCVLESGMLLVREWFRFSVGRDAAVTWLTGCTEAVAARTESDYTFLLTLSQCAAVVAVRIHGSPREHEAAGRSPAEQLRHLVEENDSSQSATCARSTLKALMDAVHAKQRDSAVYRVLLLCLSAVRNMSASGSSAGKGWTLLQKHYVSPSLVVQCEEEVARRIGTLVNEEIAFDDAVQHFCCLAALLSHLQSVAALQGGSTGFPPCLPRYIDELTRAVVRLAASLDDVGRLLGAAMHDEHRQGSPAQDSSTSTPPDGIGCGRSGLSFPGAGGAMGKWVDRRTDEKDPTDGGGDVDPSAASLLLVYQRAISPFLVTVDGERSSCLLQLAASASRLRSAVGAVGTTKSRECSGALNHLTTAVLWAAFRSFGFLPTQSSLSTSLAAARACPLLRRTTWNAVPALVLCAEPRSQTDPQLTLVCLRLTDKHATADDAGSISPLLLSSAALAMLDWRCFSRQDVCLAATLRDDQSLDELCRPAASPTGYLPLESVLQPWIEPIDGAASLQLLVRNTAADRLFDHFALLRAHRVRRSTVVLDPSVVLIARKGKVLFTITNVQDLVSRMAQFGGSGGQSTEKFE